MIHYFLDEFGDQQEDSQTSGQRRVVQGFEHHDDCHLLKACLEMLRYRGVESLSPDRSD